MFRLSKWLSKSYRWAIKQHSPHAVIRTCRIETQASDRRAWRVNDGFGRFCRPRRSCRNNSTQVISFCGGRLTLNRFVVIIVGPPSDRTTSQPQRGFANYSKSVRRLGFVR